MSSEMNTVYFGFSFLFVLRILFNQLLVFYLDFIIFASNYPVVAREKDFC
jgi:hypothetical protein